MDYWSAATSGYGLVSLDHANKLHISPRQTLTDTRTMRREWSATLADLLNAWYHRVVDAMHDDKRQINGGQWECGQYARCGPAIYCHTIVLLHLHLHLLTQPGLWTNYGGNMSMQMHGQWCVLLLGLLLLIFDLHLHELAVNMCGLSIFHVWINMCSLLMATVHTVDWYASDRWSFSTIRSLATMHNNRESALHRNQ